MALKEFLDAVEPRTALAFNFLDRDNDGEIQLEEAQENLDVILAKLPGVDRAVTEEIRACMANELETDLPDLPEPGDFFTTADTDRSLSINGAEWSTSIENKVSVAFGKIDSDNTSSIELHEFKYMLQQKATLKLARRQCASSAFGMGF